MKKFFLCGLAAVIALFSCILPDDNASAAAINPARPAEGSTEELYQDVTLTLLEPAIQKAVNQYYRKYFRDCPAVAPYEIGILKTERPNGYRTFVFIMEIEVMPYFGPHNSVGRDRITLEIGAGDKVQIRKYEHLVSYELPPNCRDEIKNKWPQEPSGKVRTKQQRGLCPAAQRVDIRSTRCTRGISFCFAEVVPLV